MECGKIFLVRIETEDQLRLELTYFLIEERERSVDLSNGFPPISELCISCFVYFVC